MFETAEIGNGLELLVWVQQELLGAVKPNGLDFVENRVPRGLRKPQIRHASGAGEKPYDIGCSQAVAGLLANEVQGL